MDHIDIPNGKFQTKRLFLSIAHCSRCNYQLIIEIKLNDSLVLKIRKHVIKPAESTNTQSFKKECLWQPQHECLDHSFCGSKHENKPNLPYSRKAMLQFLFHIATIKIGFFSTHHVTSFWKQTKNGMLLIKCNFFPKFFCCYYSLIFISQPKI